MKTLLYGIMSIALFGAGMLVGAIGWRRTTAKIAGGEPAAQRGANATSAQSETSARKSRLQVEERRHEAAMAPPVTPAAPSPTARSQWELLRELHKMGILTEHSISLLKANGGLTDAAAQMLGLTDPERDTIEHAIKQARERIAELELQNSAVGKDAAGNLLITVNPFPEAGGTIYDELIGSIGRTLGPDRNAAFLTLGAGQLDRTFGQFGIAKRLVTISKTTNQGLTRYEVRDSRSTPGANSHTTSHYRDRAGVASQLSGLSQLIPPDL